MNIASGDKVRISIPLQAPESHEEAYRKRNRVCKSRGIVTGLTTFVAM